MIHPRESARWQAGKRDGSVQSPALLSVPLSAWRLRSRARSGDQPRRRRLFVMANGLRLAPECIPLLASIRRAGGSASMRLRSAASFRSARGPDPGFGKSRGEADWENGCMSQHTQQAALCQQDSGCCGGLVNLPTLLPQASNRICPSKSEWGSPAPKEARDDGAIYASQVRHPRACCGKPIRHPSPGRRRSSLLISPHSTHGGFSECKKNE